MHPVRAFAEAILHGNEEHRTWLLGAADAFIAGEPLPSDRSVAPAPIARLAHAPQPEAARVVDLFTKQPYQGNGQGAPEPEEPEIDVVGIALLEDALAQFRAGQASGVIIIGWDETVSDFLEATTLPPGEIMSVSAVRYLGYIEILRQRLLEYSEIEEFGGDVFMLDENGATIAELPVE